jgi:phytoene dehydrogenase-like protein
MKEPTPNDYAFDCIVVGGGIAGLTSAAYLARSGRKVLLIEKNKEPGGLVNTFEHHGFQFDAGVRALEDAGIIFPMLNDLGIPLPVVKSPVSVGIEDEIVHIETIADLEKYRGLLVKLFPESEAETDALLKTIRKIMKHMEVLYGIENPVFKDLKNDRDYLFRKLLPWLPKFIFTVGRINRMNGPVEAFLATIIRNSSLRDMIAQHFFRNTPAFFALSYFSLYLDYFYPEGGVGKLPEAMTNKILEFGGSLRTETRITRVSPVKKELTDQNGQVYTYRHMVWAADLKTLYRISETEGLKPEIRAKAEETGRRVGESRGTDSVFSLFLEVDVPLDRFRETARGHFFYTPSRMGLGETHRGELQELLSRPGGLKKEEVMEWLGRFTRLNTYEISIPGLKDPRQVPPGQSGVIISFLAEYDLFKAVQKAGWLDEFTHEMENQMTEVITASVYPFMRGKVLSRFSFSPLSIEQRVGSSEGAIVGWAFRKSMPVVNRIQFSDRSVLTPLPDVFQAGQWAYSPAGVPMSILTGKLAADRILKLRNS